MKLVFVYLGRGWQGILQNDNGHRVAVTRGNQHSSPGEAALALLKEEPQWFGIRQLDIRPLGIIQATLVDHDRLGT